MTASNEQYSNSMNTQSSELNSEKLLNLTQTMGQNETLRGTTPRY
jgi:hypothetical protein